MRQSTTSLRPLRGALLALVALSGPALAGDDRVVFDGDVRPPWKLYLGSESNWTVPVWGEETTSHMSEVVVVRLAEENGADIVQAEWSGGLGQVYFQQDIATDFSALVEGGYALSVVARVDRKPKKSVEFKMDCGYPCGGAVNVTRLFKAVPEGQWFRVSFKLGCFEEAGANMANIFSPLVVATKDDFTVSFSEIRLTDSPPAESIVDCG